MGPHYGEFDADERIREKHTRSNVEFRRSRVPDITIGEDLQEATAMFEYNRDRAEWCLAIRGSITPWRTILGVLVITLKDDGELVVSIE